MRLPGTTVVTSGWNVAAVTSSAWQGARLSVFRGFWRGRPRYGEGEGRRFPTSEAAWQWAFEHGYTREYRIGWCRLCRKQHWFCGHRMANCAAAEYPYPGCVEAQEHFDREAKADQRWRMATRRPIAETAARLAKRLASEAK
jgi:hypothetical protein